MFEGLSVRALRFRVRALWRRIGVKVGLIAALSLVAALLAFPLSPLIPDWLAEWITTETVKPVLDALATSMLAVTTFSLGVMVSTRMGAAGSATPRADRLLREDRRTQNVLATFLGAFLYSLVARILLQTHAYDGQALVISFAFSLLVLGLVVVAMVNWINHLGALGSMDSVIERIGKEGGAALERAAAEPGNGTAAPDTAAEQAAGWTVTAPSRGHVCFLDFEALEGLAREMGVAFHIKAPPGSHVVTGDTLVRLAADPGEKAKEIVAAFHLGPARTFDQDGRLGLVLMSEIASRALSPGVNDPGTAVNVIGWLEDMIRANPLSATAQVDWPALHMAPLDPAQMCVDAFAAIARDGAGQIEVAGALVAALARIAAEARLRGDTASAGAAEAMAALALAHAEAKLPLDRERQMLRDLWPGSVPG